MPAFLLDVTQTVSLRTWEQLEVGKEGMPPLFVAQD